ncbi:WGxxGxxG family protein [Actinophytocola algeriensis]|uniref:MYXO-CTERM domain-containing protein n=1 Tax=Actinophytocola algeriensis TaxID=1768010 RepID=A0A7W7VDQ6_9PSEU|nr:WGxxGxxG family protein [Actinophytocola algeriensis]MBB4906225.1 MYXO-CTERM domain-containing protein [Actinophytocola algeriensis]MBE1472090.1 MYXO-CTERM domain-containing protein [Actinophytocola algeriensis]
MKRTVRNGLVAAATLAVVIGGPAATATPAVPHTVMAQQQDEDRDRGDQDDDHGLWGLLGLVGLVGLLGLIRRGRRNDQLAGPAVAPPVTQSEMPARQPVDHIQPGAPQQYADPARPPRDGGYRQL